MIFVIFDFLILLCFLALGKIFVHCSSPVIFGSVPLFFKLCCQVVYRIYSYHHRASDVRVYPATFISVYRDPVVVKLPMVLPAYIPSLTWILGRNSTSKFTLGYSKIYLSFNFFRVGMKFYIFHS